MSRYPELIEKLATSRNDYLSALAGVTEGQAAVKPADGGWSILECAEHVAIVEHNLFHRLMTTPAPMPEGPQRNLEAVIVARGVDRTRKFQAPETARPTGRFGSLAEAIAAFQKARVQAMAWVEACEEDLRHCSVQHPAFGQVTGYEMVLFAVMHPLRHALQIRELRG
jgi:hypothetical protein